MSLCEVVGCGSVEPGHSRFCTNHIEIFYDFYGYLFRNKKTYQSRYYENISAQVLDLLGDPL